MRTVIASSPDLVWGRRTDRPAHRGRPGLFARLTTRFAANRAAAPPVASSGPSPVVDARRSAAPVAPAA
jgi:hypothetical protein